MIYVTGDIHGDPRRLSKAAFPEQEAMGRDDYVIILGDFGLVWNYDGENRNERYWLDWLENKSFTTLFVDGNHECFTRLYREYKVEEWNGGLTHVIRPHVRHLMRGQYFILNGRTFWSFGGARSHDIQDGVLDPVKDINKILRWKNDYTKFFRIDGVTWWKEEMPTTEEMGYGKNNLKSHDSKVDFILTHDCPASIKRIISSGHYKPDELNIFFESISRETNFNCWLYGHNHVNRKDLLKFIGLYEQIVRVV